MITCTYTNDTIDSSLEEGEATGARRELGEHFKVKVMLEVDHMLGIRMEIVVKGYRFPRKHI